MPRPAKAVNTTSKHLTRDEIESRQEEENKLKGDAELLKPPEYLTERQIYYFWFIINQLKDADILGNLDVFILSHTAICIDRMATFEKKINENPNLLLNKAFMSSKDKYSKDFFKCCNELCLSPQSRAKISLLNSEGQTDPLGFLTDDDGDDYNQNA